MANITDLIGKTFVSVKQVADGGKRGSYNERVEFRDTEGKGYKMYHDQDCCESVTIEDICGELSDLEGAPIVKAEESVNENGATRGDASHTWTFYHLSTMKGSVTIRWHGTSNGYYSESVDVKKL